MTGSLNQTTAIRIEQMDCPVEERLLRKALEKQPGVLQLHFNLMSRVLSVTHQPTALEDILQVIRKIGFTPELGTAGRPGDTAVTGVSGCCSHRHHHHGGDNHVGHAHGEHAHRHDNAVSSSHADVSPNIAQGLLPVWWRLAAGGLFALIAELAHWFGAPDWLVVVSAVAAVALAGTDTYRKGLIALRYGDLNINALMSIAVTCALLIGQWPEAAMVMVLFTLSEWIEAKSLDRTRDAISGLMDLAPERVTSLQPDGTWQPVAVGLVAAGARLRIAPGERIGLDGRILKGMTTVNQAPITGESVPADKQPGDTVFAGTINESAEIEVEVTAAANSTTLARIITQIEEAQAVKAPTQRFVDTFSRYYTPAVVMLAVLLAILPPLLFDGEWRYWIYQALVVLIIACPCALVISTPVTVVSGLTAAARRGILIKGGVYLEQGHRLSWLALDKTGTITQGHPVQTDMIALREDRPVNEFQLIAASLAARSDHPVSRAVYQALPPQAGALLAVDDFVAVPGRGVQGTMAGRQWYLGSPVWAQAMGVGGPTLQASIESAEQQGQGVVVLMDDRGAVMLFTVADDIKPDSVAAIAQLHAEGVKTLMLSGDNQAVVRNIARISGVTEAQGQLLPQDKLDAIRRLQSQGGEVVGMAGDGMNDAPALAQSDISFAMGAMGSDMAIETADVALMDDNLMKIPEFLRLSRQTRRVLIQNISLALGIKAVFLALVLLGMGSMWIAVFADVGASLLVVANGLRLLKAGQAMGVA